MATLLKQVRWKRTLVKDFVKAKNQEIKIETFFQDSNV